ncbi:hypothetical protein QYF61_005263 [Mycteria americana]|uniref:Uncharacterized protein n=1 Tax=Mycteria americana TaxID=33587 RepID=A0AAN7N3V6_MYCAM|nr:hypothetical protein QYF61_005263 [Mycteria americana]
MSSDFLAEQPQLSQPVFTGEVLQPSDHLCGPPLDSLQQVHVLLMLGTPELDAVLWVGSHESGVEGQDHLPRPAGHASFDASQDTVGFLGCKHTLPCHVEVLINLHPQVLLLRDAFNAFSTQAVFVLGIAPTHVQDLACGLVEVHEVCAGPPLKPVKVPLDGIPSLQRVNRTTQLGVVGKLAEAALNPTSRKGFFRGFYARGSRSDVLPSMQKSERPRRVNIRHGHPEMPFASVLPRPPRAGKQKRRVQKASRGHSFAGSRRSWEPNANRRVKSNDALLDFSMSEDEPVPVIQGSVCSFTLVFCNYPDFRPRSIFAANQEQREVGSIFEANDLDRQKPEESGSRVLMTACRRQLRATGWVPPQQGSIPARPPWRGAQGRRGPCASAEPLVLLVHAAGTVHREPAAARRFKGSLNEVSAVEGDSPPCSELGKSSSETAMLGTVQQIRPPVGTWAGGQLLVQALGGFMTLKSGGNKEEPSHVATVVFSREGRGMAPGSPLESQHTPEDGNSVLLRARNLELHPDVAEGNGEALGASLVRGQGWRTTASLGSRV